MDKKTDKILYSPKEGTSGFWCDGLEIVNPDVFQMIWDRTTQQIKPGDIFDLPEGYEFKEEYNCSDCPITDCSSTLCPKRVIRLVPQPEPEESNDENFTDDEYAEGFKDGQEIIKSSLREQVEKKKQRSKRQTTRSDFDLGYEAALNEVLKEIDTITTKQ